MGEFVNLQQSFKRFFVEYVFLLIIREYVVGYQLSKALLWIPVDESG